MAFNLREIFKALADAKADYVVVGGLAVIMHGHLRATRDLDLVIGLSPENCRRALQALSRLGMQPRLPVAIEDFADPAKREEWLTRRNMLVFQLWDSHNAERSVDVFVREPIDFAQMSADAVVKDLDGVPIPVASIRHLIRLKQTAGRRQDIDDIDAHCAKLRGRRVNRRPDVTDPLQCTFVDAARNHLLDGIRLSTAAKVDFFEEMVTLAVHFGARNRTRERGTTGPDDFDSIPRAGRGQGGEERAP